MRGGVLLGGFGGGPTVIVVVEFETSVGMTSDHTKPLRVACHSALPPHAADGAALDEGRLVEVCELDAFNNVAMTTQHKAHVVLVEQFSNVVCVVDEGLGVFAFARICVHLVPDGEEGDVGDDHDGNVFPDPFEISL